MRDGKLSHNPSPATVAVTDEELKKGKVGSMPICGCSQQKSYWDHFSPVCQFASLYPNIERPTNKKVTPSKLPYYFFPHPSSHQIMEICIWNGSFDKISDLSCFFSGSTDHWYKVYRATGIATGNLQLGENSKFKIQSSCSAILRFSWRQKNLASCFKIDTSEDLPVFPTPRPIHPIFKPHFTFVQNSSPILTCASQNSTISPQIRTFQILQDWYCNWLLFTESAIWGQSCCWWWCWSTSFIILIKCLYGLKSQK